MTASTSFTSSRTRAMGFRQANGQYDPSANRHHDGEAAAVPGVWAPSFIPDLLPGWPAWSQASRHTAAHQQLRKVQTQALAQRTPRAAATGHARLKRASRPEMTISTA
jgi:hypothetical protein